MTRVSHRYRLRWGRAAMKKVRGYDRTTDRKVVTAATTTDRHKMRR